MTLGVKVHHVKYIKKHGYLKDGRQITRKDPMGIALQALLVPKDKGGRPLNNFNQPTIDISLGGETHLQYRCELPDANLKGFMMFVDDLIDKEFCTIARSYQKLEKGIDEAIDYFQDEYDFTDDEVSVDRLRKAYFRWRVKRGLL